MLDGNFCENSSSSKLGLDEFGLDWADRGHRVDGAGGGLAPKPVA